MCRCSHSHCVPQRAERGCPFLGKIAPDSSRQLPGISCTLYGPHWRLFGVNSPCYIPDSCFSPPCTGSRGQRVPECGPAALPAASARTGQPVRSGGASGWGCTHLLQRHPDRPAEWHQVELLYLWPAMGRETQLPKGSHVLLLQLGEVVGHHKCLFSLPCPKSPSQWFLGTAALQDAVLLPQRHFPASHVPRGLLPHTVLLALPHPLQFLRALSASQPFGGVPSAARL